MALSFLSTTVDCLPGEFACETGYGCLDPSLVCSVYVECADKSDERGCGMNNLCSSFLFF